MRRLPTNTHRKLVENSACEGVGDCGLHLHMITHISGSGVTLYNSICYTVWRLILNVPGISTTTTIFQLSLEILREVPSSGHVGLAFARGSSYHDSLGDRVPAESSF